MQNVDTDTLPHSIEAEQAVLGGILLNNDAWEIVTEHLVERMFYRREHQQIFNAMHRLFRVQKECDMITVADELGDELETVGVNALAYLSRLVENTPSAANAGAYAEIVRNRARLRALVNISQNLISKAMDKTADADGVVELAERSIFALNAQASGKNGLRTLNDVMASAINRLDELFQSGKSITGVSTGFADLDKQTSGLQNTDLIIIAGRPSMGKTSFAMNIAEHAAIKDGLPVAVFSMEMSSEQLAMRLISSLGRVNSQRVNTGQLSDEEWPQVSQVVASIDNAPLFIDDSPALSPSEVRSRCLRLVREHGQLGLIVIDYLQLMQIESGSDNRTGEISEISRALKALAKELKTPVVALSQLNRSLEQRQNKRPVMSDLRESGAIEQDADVIMFVYRDEVYNEDSEDRGMAEIIISKQRNGPIGTVKLSFLKEYTRFENLAWDVQ